MSKKQRTMENRLFFMSPLLTPPTLGLESCRIFFQAHSKSHRQMLLGQLGCENAPRAFRGYNTWDMPLFFGWGTWGCVCVSVCVVCACPQGTL